jgi:glucokinase
MSERCVLAVDIGGTKLAAGVVSDSGRLLCSDRFTTPRAVSADTLFDTLRTLCRTVLNSAPVEVEAIGVGCGGPMQYPDGLVSPLNIPSWRAFPLRERLAAAFELPCVVDNDAAAMAVGERWLGAGRGSDNMLGMVVSTGVGGGIILEGRLLHGFAGNAGHVGHIVVWTGPDAPRCTCGGRGCLEAVASGTGLGMRLGDALAAGAQTSLQSDASAADIAAAARQGDALAMHLFQTAGEGVGRGIASAAALLDLELVTIGGSVALYAWDLLGAPLEAELRRSARLDFTRDVRVVRAELGDSAGVFGAARLALLALGFG